ncbi:MAG: hypothetical protein ISS35_05935 [Kiritimatiellae bacterium]|nr:hypothetical protein [Kiritimatiellia bacterium]
MRAGHLFIRELRFRRVSVVLAIVAAAAVSACVVGARSFLAAHDAETEKLIAALEERAADRMAQLRDDARVFSKNLGFNILLLPGDQDAGRLYAENRSTAFFTRKQVQALGSAELATLNHLLPMLRHQIHWDQYDGNVILVGIEGEIYIKSPNFQKPIEERVDAGMVHIGNAIHKRLKLQIGAQLEIEGETFTVKRVLPQKGNIDDISLLMNLGDAQRLSGQPGKISGVLALSCNCAAGDLDPIRQELERVVQDVQVVEFSVRAQARQRARSAIGKRTKEEMQDITESRAILRSHVAQFATLLVSLVVVGAAIFLTVLTFASVRERRSEVALLRALGLGSLSIFALMLYKAVLTGLAGGIFGCLVGVLAGRWILGISATATTPFMLSVISATVAIATLASALPALMAARIDPAVILNQE